MKIDFGRVVRLAIKVLPVILPAIAGIKQAVREEKRVPPKGGE